MRVRLPRVGRVRGWFAVAALLRFAGPVLLVPTAILVLLSGLMPMAFMVAMSRITQDVTSSQGGRAAMAAALTRAGPYLLLAFFALAGQQLTAPFQEALSALAARNIDRHTLAGLLSASLRAPLGQVEKQHAVSIVTEVTDAFMRNAPTPGVAAAALPRLAARYLQLAASIAVIAVVTSWPVALLLAAGAVIIRRGQRGALDKFTREWAALSAERQRMNYFQAFGIDLSAVKEIRVLDLLAWLRHRYDGESETYLRQLRRRRRAILFRPFLVYTAIGFVLAFAAFAVLSRSYDPVTGVAVLVLAGQAMLVPLRFGVYFPECDPQTQYGMQYQSQVDAYRALVHRPEAEAEPVPDGPVPRARAPLPAGAAHEIRFVDVRFQYPQASHDMLRGLDLCLEAGRSTALVGVNGAGKTTIVKLLTGGYPPTSGRILVDGKNLADIDLRDWCRRVAVIFQNFVRFDLTLRENLRLGAAYLPENRDAMVHALARAHARDILDMLPDGLDTVLSPEYPGGVGLSGGQWQRVALARAFYAVSCGATVLLLDEPTAQLDVRSEIDFYTRFLELTEGLTTLVISHRFSTVRRADTIAVLAGGRIEESGSHDELMTANGNYAAMFRAQADRFDGPAGSGMAQ
jgi:ATP-binding cassette, subfamily B, bacterial